MFRGKEGSVLEVVHPKARERNVYEIDYLNEKQNWYVPSKDRGEETWVENFNF